MYSRKSFAKMDLDSCDDGALLDVFTLPDDIFARVDEDFYSVVKLLEGDSLLNILRIQLINSARKLLNTANVFAFFQIESEDTDAIKAECCFKSKTGQYIVKPGIRTSLSNFMKLLHQKLNEEQGSTSNENEKMQERNITNEFLDKHPLLKSLIKWYQQNDLEDQKRNHFLTSFVDTLVFNLTQSSNNFRYSDTIKEFAACLYILGGKQLYDFVRLNLPGAIPSTVTIIDLINKSNTTLAEAEFKFQSLQQFDSGFGFCSEDTTGVLRKVEYDSSTNSFVGFSTPVVDGVPSQQRFQADTFNDLQTIFNTNEIARLLNVHMFQSIPEKDYPVNVPKPFLLSAYGVDNRFRTMDVLRRWMYMFESCLDVGVRIVGFSTGKFH